jgi:hypothetical protein
MAWVDHRQDDVGGADQIFPQLPDAHVVDRGGCEAKDIDREGTPSVSCGPAAG